MEHRSSYFSLNGVEISVRAIDDNTTGLRPLRKDADD
jgi:hypothetical protein